MSICAGLKAVDLSLYSLLDTDFPELFSIFFDIIQKFSVILERHLLLIQFLVARSHGLEILIERSDFLGLFKLHQGFAIRFLNAQFHTFAVVLNRFFETLNPLLDCAFYVFTPLKYILFLSLSQVQAVILRRPFWVLKMFVINLGH